MTGVEKGQPSAWICRSIRSYCRMTVPRSASDIRPPTGSGISVMVSRSQQTIPPCMAISRFAACTINSSLLPVTIRLWLSCAMVDPKAPSCRLNPGDVADGRRSVRGVAVQDDHLLVAPFFPGRDQFFTGNQRSLFGTNDP